MQPALPSAWPFSALPNYRTELMANYRGTGVRHEALTLLSVQVEDTGILDMGGGGGRQRERGMMGDL